MNNFIRCTTMFDGMKYLERIITMTARLIYVN